VEIVEVKSRGNRRCRYVWRGGWISYAFIQLALCSFRYVTGIENQKEEIAEDVK
jgi:hypothetical protein